MVTVPVELTNEVRRGVVSLPHGWGYDRSGTRLHVAEKRAGVSINDLTSERHLDTLSGNAAFNGLREPCDESPRAVAMSTTLSEGCRQSPRTVDEPSSNNRRREVATLG